MSDVSVGCCGFPVSRVRYHRAFKVVEVQRTFYHPPALSTAARWRERAPVDFEFALKAWQLITHRPSSPTYRRLRMEIAPDSRDRYGSFQPTKEVMEAWERTRDFARALGATIVVFQCPASFRPIEENLRNMRRFFGETKEPKLTFAWEPRGEWSAEKVADLCGELGLVHCVDPFKNEPVSSGMRYFRLHGRKGYRYRYTENDLVLLREACLSQEKCYCMFNNVSMFDDARAFQRALGQGSSV